MLANYANEREVRSWIKPQRLKGRRAIDLNEPITPLKFTCGGESMVGSVLSFSALSGLPLEVLIQIRESGIKRNYAEHHSGNHHRNHSSAVTKNPSRSTARLNQHS